MRVKVLVAAAMAITSVNAGLSDIICDASNRILGCFGLGNSMSRAESRERLLLDDLSRDPESAKKKLDYGPDGDGKDPLCDPIISKLSDLYDEAVALSYNIPRQRRVSYDPRGYWAKDPDRDEYGYIEVDKLAARSELDDEDSLEMKQIKESLIALEKEYRKLWIPFINDCWANPAYVLSPEKMLEKEYFFRRTRVIMLETWTAPPYQ